MTSAQSGAQCRIEASSGSLIDKVLRNCKEQTLRDHICCSLHVLSARGAARGGEGGSFPLWVDVQKLCNMCVLSLSRNFFVSHDIYIARRRAKSHVDTQTIQPGLGNFVL